MTGLLKDVMTERADRLEAPAVDLDAITRAGERTVRRRRVAGLAAGTAAAVGLGFAVQLMPWPADSGGRAAVAPDRPAVVSWAIGSEIHTEAETIDVGHTVHAYVRTDVGFVVQDADGTVWSVTSGEPERVGAAPTNGSALKADGPLAGWVEFPAGQAPQFVILDQSTGSIVRNSDGTEPGMSELADESNPAYLYALDGRRAYWRDTRGLVRYDVDAKESTVLGPALNGFDLADVEDGLLVRPAETEFEARTIVGADLDTDEPSFPVATPAYLSPRATYLMSENLNDDFRVLKVGTGADLTPRAKGDYAFFYGFEWLDDDTYAAEGLPTLAANAKADLLTCEVSTRECTVIAEAVGSVGDFQVPSGRHSATR